MTPPNPSPTHPGDRSTTPPTPSYRGGVGVGVGCTTPPWDGSDATRCHPPANLQGWCASVHHQGSDLSPPEALGGSRARGNPPRRRSEIQRPSLPIRAWLSWTWKWRPPRAIRISERVTPKPVWVEKRVASQIGDPPLSSILPFVSTSHPPYTDKKEDLMPEPTAFEIACTKEAAGTDWPDLAGIVFKAPVVVVETRSCVRCARPVEGDRCPSCRAHQGTYAGSL